MCGSSNHIKLNEWCYFKSPQTGNLYFKTGSDDGSGLWLNDTLIVSDNNGGHGVRWRDSPAQSLISGHYYALEIDWAEHTGGQALYNRWDTSPGDNSNGNIVDSEGYPFYGDEWLINVAVNGTEEVALPSEPTLNLPSNTSSTKDITPTFQWANGGNTEYFTLLVDNEIDLYDGDEWINVTVDASTETYTIPGGSALYEEGKWYWIVIANNTQGKNASAIWNFIVDTTPPLPVSLDAPSNNSVTDTNQITFSWDATSDNTTNSSFVSYIKCYHLQVDDNQDFSSPLIDENTTDNTTLSLTQQIAGRLYWHVRAWDQAGNPGVFSPTWTLTVFNFALNPSSTTLQMQRGYSDFITISVNLVFGDIENVTLESYWSSSVKPNSITINISSIEEPISFDSTITFTCGGSATTGSFICTINATSDSGIKKTINITVTVYSMLFSIDGFPRSISLLRSDSEAVTIAVQFDQGVLDDVTLSGAWIEDTPSGVSVDFDISFGTPPYDSLITFSTTSTAEAGSFIYTVTGGGSGLNKTVNIYVYILTSLTLTASTDKTSYYKGQKIEISGVVKDENNDFVNGGTVTLNLKENTWNDKVTTSISDGTYQTNYFITYDKPAGNWTISVTAKDSRGHITTSATTFAISVLIPESHKHYQVNVLNPLTGQLFNRGDLIPFTVSITEKTEKILGLKVKAYAASGEEIIFTETSPGIYSANYKLNYDCSLGNWSLYIEGAKFEEEKLKAGFDYITFEVQPTRPIVELIDYQSDSIEVGETIQIRVKAIYPDRTPVEEGIVTAGTPEGGMLLFTKTGINTYTASYTPIETSVGNWWIEVTIEDAYGNVGSIIGDNFVIVPASATSILVRYWWATTIAIIALLLIGVNFTLEKMHVFKLQNLKQEMLDFQQMKREKAIQYFSKGEISRQTYDKLFQEYESKMATITKKIRILERKVVEKKPFIQQIKKLYKK
jgi:hypothetical protein